MIIDYLIIGQGLAGSLLAWELIQRNCKLLVIDNGQENASQVAAGLINPVTGMRFVKSSEVDLLLPAAKAYYAQLSHTFQQPFYIEKPMLRLFRKEAELTHCLKRLQDKHYQDYLSAITPPDPNRKEPIASFGFVEQKQTGYLLTRNLLSHLKDFFIVNGCYRQAPFNYQDIQLTPSASWHDVNPKKIIFCEGYQALHNPWFSWLPFQLAKGEIVTLEYQGELADKILNFGHWLIPLDNQTLRLGATFDRTHINRQATPNAQEELLKSLASVLPSLSTKVLDQQANVRPCTLDKQPFIGEHPNYPDLVIFNGFGAKGSLQIPWYCQRFAESLLNNHPAPSSIQRYYATHFTG